MISTGTKPRNNGQSGRQFDREFVIDNRDPVDIFDLLAEDSLAGAVLAYPEECRELVAGVKPAWFTREQNQAIFEAYLSRLAKGGPLDTMAIRHELANIGKLAIAGGDPELQRLVGQASYKDQIPAQVEQLGDRFTARRVLEEIQDIANQVSRPGRDVRGLAERLRIEDIPSSREIFQTLTAAELESGNFDLEWLVDDLLVKGQPAAIGGPTKSLKTTFGLSLALKLATGGLWLDRFQIQQARRVLMMSGESGLGTIQETAKRICRSWGWSLGRIENFHLSAAIPRFDRPEHCVELERIIRKLDLEVVFVDPWYLACGAVGNASSNVYDMGNLLSDFSGIGARTGVTLVILHHTRKNLLSPHEPLDHTDLAGAGIAEFVRAWLLFNRRKKYNPSTPGLHKMWFTWGGSAGQSGLMAIDVDETRDERNTRQWEIETLTAEQARQREAESDEEDKEQRADKKRIRAMERKRLKLVGHLRANPDGDSVNGIKSPCGLKTDEAETILGELEEAGFVERCEITKSNRQKYSGYRLTREGLSRLGNPDCPDSLSHSLGNSLSIESSPSGVWSGVDDEWPIDATREVSGASNLTPSGEPASGRDF